MTQEEVNEILEKHRKWLNHEDGGEKADLRCANLSNVNLYGADLKNADLGYADLSNANLNYANLRGANLICADLSYADLHYADLRYANLSYTNLRNADLYGIDLPSANLSNAILRGAKNVPYIALKCPSEGAFIGWKKCYLSDKPYIVKLQIPASAKRVSGTTEKCRCNKAKVLDIYDMDGTKVNIPEVYSGFACAFKYEIGKMVYADSFDEDRWNECSHGIHFFVNKEDAIKW